MKKTYRTIEDGMLWLGVGMDACNPRYLEGGFRRIKVQGQPGQKVWEFRDLN
jgi:hypothetical protein